MLLDPAIAGRPLVGVAEVVAGHHPLPSVVVSQHKSGGNLEKHYVDSLICGLRIQP